MSVATRDLAEAAFYLHHGLTLSSVDLSSDDEANRAQVSIVFEGDRSDQVARSWCEDVSPVVIPHDVKLLLVALGTLAGASL